MSNAFAASIELIKVVRHLYIVSFQNFPFRAFFFIDICYMAHLPNL